MVAAVSRVATVHYAEIIASISSRSAGPGTRANIDEFGQAVVPATVGTALGALFGNMLAVPVLGVADKVLSTGSTVIPLWIDIAVPALALCATAVTALVPAHRAGRLRTIEALAAGRVSYAGGGRTVQHLLARLPLPRALSLGLASAFSRPLRSATTAAAVVLGTIGVTFGVGLTISLGDVQNGLNRENAGSVLVQPIMQSGTKHPKRTGEAGVPS
jgi:putative ABC transport system permease protein